MVSARQSDWIAAIGVHDVNPSIGDKSNLATVRRPCQATIFRIVIGQVGGVAAIRSHHPDFALSSRTLDKCKLAAIWGPVWATLIYIVISHSEDLTAVRVDYEDLTRSESRITRGKSDFACAPVNKGGGWGRGQSRGESRVP